MEVTSVKLRNGKAADKDEVMEEVIYREDELLTDWFWKLCNMAIENGVMTEDWRSAFNVPL